MGTTTGTTGMAEPTPTPKKRVNKLVEAIAKASASEPEADPTLDKAYRNGDASFLSKEENAKWEKQEKARSDRILFREALKAFIVALEVKHPAHIGAAVTLADEYVKVVNMRYPLDLT